MFVSPERRAVVSFAFPEDQALAARDTELQAGRYAARVLDLFIWEVLSYDID
jgi:hypothetical protein